MQEVDLNIIETLIRLGRKSEARAAASEFVRRYPKSLRAAEMSRLAQ